MGKSIIENALSDVCSQAIFRKAWNTLRVPVFSDQPCSFGNDSGGNAGREPLADLYPCC